MSTDTQQREAWIAEARELGRTHAANAARWAVDGNTKQEAIRYVIALLDDGDPAIDAYLPKRPNLSGEYADDLNVRTLFDTITGDPDSWDEYALASLPDELAEAYEAGVDDAFMTECERVFRAALDDAS